MQLQNAENRKKSHFSEKSIDIQKRIMYDIDTKSHISESERKWKHVKC